ncbi:MAG: inositol 2-dehydrogenase [Suipraeoptans sp.]
MENKIVVGVIGGGSIGRLHISNIKHAIPNIELRYVVDPFPDNYNEWASQNGYPNAISDYNVILQDPDIQGVLICSSASTHADLTIECAKAGKHVFCEKPLDYDLEKIKDVIKIAQKHNIKVQMGYNRRFDHNFSRAHKHVLEDKVGEVRHIKITSRDPLPPPEEYFKAVGGSAGGMFLDTSIHDIDMARYMARGAEVIEIFATGSAMVNKEAVGGVDTSTIVLKFDTGAMAIIDNCWQCTYGYDQRLEVFGSKGFITVDNDKESTCVLNNEYGAQAEQALYFYNTRYIKAYRKELERFAESILNETNVLVDEKDGYYSVLIAKACDISVKEKRIVSMEEMIKI